MDTTQPKMTATPIRLPDSPCNKKHKSVIYKVTGVLSTAKIARAETAIESHPCFLTQPVFNDYLFALDMGFEKEGIAEKKVMVHFDSQSKMTDKSQLDEALAKTCMPIKELVYEGVEALSARAGYKDMQVGINPQILRYHVDEHHPDITDLVWHDDPCGLTMTVLLSEPQQSRGSYSGGGLSFASAYRKPGAFPDYFEDTILSCDYTFNGGFIFDNFDTRHKAGSVHFQELSATKPTLEKSRSQRRNDRSQPYKTRARHNEPRDSQHPEKPPTDSEASPYAEKHLLTIFSWPGEDFVQQLWQKNFSEKPI